jgi:hypothetical protein
LFILGGVEQLEKQFGGTKGEKQEATVAPNIPKSLYDRVLGVRTRPSNSGGGSAIVEKESPKSRQPEPARYVFTNDAIFIKGRQLA